MATFESKERAPSPSLVSELNVKTNSNENIFTARRGNMRKNPRKCNKTYLQNILTIKRYFPG